MSDILILARVQLNEFDALTLGEYASSAQERLANVEGFVGMASWQRHDNPYSVLIAYHYADVDAAERGLVALTGIRLLTEQQSANYRPADVLRVKLKSKRGSLLHEVPTGGFLSLSVRVADPGYGQELDDEIDRIFDELQLLPGFLGAMHGPNDVLEEEIVGLAFWTDAASFAASIPPSARNYEVMLYRRFS